MTPSPRTGRLLLGMALGLLLVAVMVVVAGGVGRC